MIRRPAALGAALALSLSLSGVLATGALAAPSASPTASSTPAEDAAQALSQLRRDAEGPVRIARDADGAVTSLSSSDGSAMLESDASTPARAVKETLADYGEAVGIDGEGSTATVTRAVDSPSGGSVVRAQQVVGGVPVFGGQVVVSLNQGNDVTSITAATAAANTSVPAAVVGEDAARATAVATTARQQHVAASSLSTTDGGRRLYDPSLVGGDPRLGVRAVWQFSVTNRSQVRETVLVGSTHGEVVVAFNDAPTVNRRVCDAGNERPGPGQDTTPPCAGAAVRTEDGGTSSVADVNQAFANLGAASVAYDELDELDLTDLIGASVNGSKTLMSTVRWCFNDPTQACPYDNAFWDGSQMVFGQGYAGADDVVGHELTHGYVERTSNLYSVYQSGAINESVSDTIGEIIDHRNGADDDSAWKLGETLPGGALRSMRNPTLSFQGQPAQPDRMTSPYFERAEATDENGDDGAVHRNDGVGNKTAYLISQGGTFNGQTITGIDGSDTGLAKTGRLYLETIPRLTSGADYAQLGRVLVSTCQSLVAGSAPGFSPADCTSVSRAVAATELGLQPVTAGAAAPKVAVACATGTPEVLMRDDDAVDDFGLTLGEAWRRTPDPDAPTYASSGAGSLFAWDPGDTTPRSASDDAVTDATSNGFTLPAAASSYLQLDQARLLAFDGDAYASGGEVLVQRLDGGSWRTVSGLPWVNGPTQTLYGTSTKVFGGDSHGYGSSRVDLSSLAGQSVRLVLRIDGAADETAFTGGWWVDNLQLYTCPPLPTAPSSLSVAAGAGSATLAWGAPAVFPGYVDHYLVTRSGGAGINVPATTRRVTLRGFSGTSAATVAVTAVTSAGARGPTTSRVINATATSLSPSLAKVRRNKTFVLTARVLRRGSSASAGGVGVLLQRRSGASWVNISSGTTGRTGTRAWALRQPKSTYYRVLTRPGGLWFGSASSARLVKKK